MDSRTPIPARPAIGRRTSWRDPETFDRYGELPPPFAVPRPLADPLLLAVQEVYDTTADSYDGHYVDAVAEAEHRLVRTALSALLRAMRPGRLVVDLGCGTGLALQILPELAPDGYLGLDISHGMLDQARAKYPDHRFVWADLRRPIFRPLLNDQPLGLLLSLFGAVCYQPDPLACLDRLLDEWPDAALAVILFGPTYEPRAPEPRATRLAAHELGAWLAGREQHREGALWAFSPRGCSLLVERVQWLLERVMPRRFATRLLTPIAHRLLEDAAFDRAGYFLVILGPERRDG